MANPAKRYYARVRLQPSPKFGDLWVEAASEDEAIEKFKSAALESDALRAREAGPEVEVVYMREVLP